MEGRADVEVLDGQAFKNASHLDCSRHYDAGIGGFNQHQLNQAKSRSASAAELMVFCCYDKT